jgi:hypothetical protein
MLPPLILHPFSNATDPVRVLANSKAIAVAPSEQPKSALAAAQLQRKLLLTRYCEVRMLWCIGKDLLRWVDQCIDFSSRHEELRRSDVRFQSFSSLLIENTPAAVADKLRGWGVADYPNIFARAIGLNTVFAEMPALGILAEEFLRDYYNLTYQLYVCRQQSGPFMKLDPSVFGFDVFTSGEYIKIIERQVTGK